jgi:hypothetical protein
LEKGNKMIKTLITSCAIWLVVTANAQTVAERIAAGRTHFEQRDIARANENFAAALALEPNNTTANVFYAATRLLALSKTPAFNTLMDRVGVSSTNRDVFSWSAEFRTDATGFPIAAEGLSAQEVVTFLRGTLLPEVEGAIANLAKIEDTAFLLNLTAAEAFAAGPVTADYADIRLLRASLEFGRYLLYTISMHNFEAQAEAIRSLYEADQLNLEQVLRRFPQLLTLSSTNDLAPAKNAFQKSISDYLTASSMIRARPTNVVRLFNLDENEAEGERQFRVTLVELERSLDTVVQLAEAEGVTAHAGALFSAPKGWRELMPEFARNDVIAGTFPDPTFGGVLQGVEGYQLESELSGVGVDVVPRLIPPRAVMGNLQISVNALKGEQLLFLRSADLKNWEFYGLVLPTNGVVTFTESFPLASSNSYFIVSDRFPPPVIVAPLDPAALTAQNKIYTANIAGQAEALILTFPSAGNYQFVQGAIVEVGAVSGPNRIANTWIMNITPAAGQEGAQAGILYLQFSAADAGAWSFVPFGGQVETGTFAVILPPGGDPTGEPGVTKITGRTLQITYESGAGERFYFTTDTQVSYEDGVFTGTYTWDSVARSLNVTLENGWSYKISIPLGGNTASVIFQSAGENPVTDPARYTLN